MRQGVGPDPYHLSCGAEIMSWTKPEAEIVAVTMEVTAYVATL
jgi:coenzyme PQQ precursor peptide PqqA